MKIAVAVEGKEEKAASHFAHCSHFVVFDIDGDEISKRQKFENPFAHGHRPGQIPEFVQSLGAGALITNGIGPSAIGFFNRMGIRVFYGASGSAEELARKYCEGKLKADENSCNH
jgi:predicted Fe-Mo cluster-binding NifX family protein